MAVAQIIKSFTLKSELDNSPGLPDSESLMSETGRSGNSGKYSMWFVYILKCRDGSYYTGITNDVSARLAKHNAGEGAKYTRSRRPCTIVYVENHPDDRAARQREREIKGWRRNQKEELIRDFPSSDLREFLEDSGDEK